MCKAYSTNRLAKFMKHENPPHADFTAGQTTGGLVPCITRTLSKLDKRKREITRFCVSLSLLDKNINMDEPPFCIIQIRVGSLSHTGNTDVCV